MIMHIFFLVFSMPRRGSILDSRSDRSRSFQTSYRLNNKGSMFHHPVYHNSKKYYIPTLGSTHPPQHDYGRVDTYQYCEGFRFQDLFLTQGGFSRDNQLAYEGHNSYRSCRTWATSRRSSTLECVYGGYISGQCRETRNSLSLSSEKWCGSRHLVFWSLGTLTGLRDWARGLVA